MNVSDGKQTPPWGVITIGGFRFQKPYNTKIFLVIFGCIFFCFCITSYKSSSLLQYYWSFRCVMKGRFSPATPLMSFSPCPFLCWLQFPTLFTLKLQHQIWNILAGRAGFLVPLVLTNYACCLIVVVSFKFFFNFFFTSYRRSSNPRRKTYMQVKRFCMSRSWKSFTNADWFNIPSKLSTAGHFNFL